MGFGLALGFGSGSGVGLGFGLALWGLGQGQRSSQGGGWRAWLVELEAATTKGTTATLADPLAIDQKAGRAWGKDGLGLG